MNIQNIIDNKTGLITVAQASDSDAYPAFLPNSSLVLRTFDNSDKEKKSFYAKPVEAKGAVVIGTSQMIFVILAVIFVIVLDLNLYRKQLRSAKRTICRRWCKNR